MKKLSTIEKNQRNLTAIDECEIRLDFSTFNKNITFVLLWDAKHGEETRVFVEDCNARNIVKTTLEDYECFRGLVHVYDTGCYIYHDFENFFKQRAALIGNVIEVRYLDQK